MAAASSESSAWYGAALFVEQGDALAAIGSASSQRPIGGSLAQALEPSTALYLQAEAEIDIQLLADDFVLSGSDVPGIAVGANRLLVGGEVMQFLNASALGEGRWRLSGLLRGRAGTEDAAQSTHQTGTRVTVLDTRLTDLTGSGQTIPTDARIAAIGRGDDEAVFASIENVGLSRRPPAPVHPRVHIQPDAALLLGWTRRARGQWEWNMENDVPLVEQSENYVVGIGPVASPKAAFAVDEPRFLLIRSEIDALLAAHGTSDVWVRQVGTYASSPALFLTTLK